MVGLEPETRTTLAPRLAPKESSLTVVDHPVVVWGQPRPLRSRPRLAMPSCSRLFAPSWHDPLTRSMSLVRVSLVPEQHSRRSRRLALGIVRHLHRLDRAHRALHQVLSLASLLHSHRPVIATHADRGLSDIPGQVANDDLGRLARDGLLRSSSGRSSRSRRIARVSRSRVVTGSTSSGGSTSAGSSGASGGASTAAGLGLGSDDLGGER